MKKILLIIMLLPIISVMAQEPEKDNLPEKGAEIVVMGRVVDTDNEPLARVRVFSKGTSGITSTDEEGFYKMTAKMGDTLVFFTRNKLPQEKEITRTRVNAKLPDGELSQEEMIKYLPRDRMSQGARMQRGERGRQMGEGRTNMREGGRQRGRQGEVMGQMRAIPENIIYIVDGREVADMSKIDPEQIEEVAIQKNETITATYGSRAAEGAMIVKTKDYDESKIAKGDTKLYYVDGTETDEAEANVISKDRIEKRTELKGKNATTQYGSRAKKGVVIITTKK